MADRKRKRKSSGARTAPTRPAAREKAPAPAPPAQNGSEMMKRGYARAELKNEAVREALEPLEPGERPGILAATVAWLGLIAAVMVYNAIASNGLSNGSRVGNGVMVLLIAIAAFGTWRLEYWAILGTQTLLALTLVSLILAALVVTNVLLVLLAVAAALVSGYLFFKMVKVMARVQKTAMLQRDAAEGR
ncbi:MAG: hypothetical protein WC558_09475 [Patulibacter sp.]